MSFSSFTLELPAVCAFAADTTSNKLGFFTDTYNTVTTYPSSYDSLFTFETKAEALIKARDIDPGCPKNYVYGPVPVETTSVPSIESGDIVDCKIGDLLTLTFDVVCAADPTALVEYTWVLDGKIMADKKSNTISFTVPEKEPLTVLSFSCRADVVAADNWTTAVSKVYLYQILP
jgi:hypothetical protein